MVVNNRIHCDKLPQFATLAFAVTREQFIIQRFNFEDYQHVKLAATRLFLATIASMEQFSSWRSIDCLVRKWLRDVGAPH
jgi:hypothetical protein